MEKTIKIVEIKFSDKVDLISIPEQIEESERPNCDIVKRLKISKSYKSDYGKDLLSYFTISQTV